MVWGKLKQYLKKAHIYKLQHTHTHSNANTQSAYESICSFDIHTKWKIWINFLRWNFFFSSRSFSLLSNFLHLSSNETAVHFRICLYDVNINERKSKANVNNPSVIRVRVRAMFSSDGGKLLKLKRRCILIKITLRLQG